MSAWNKPPLRHCPLVLLNVLAKIRQVKEAKTKIPTFRLELVHQNTETNIKWDEATMAFSDAIADEINKAILEQILKNDKTKLYTKQIKKLLKQIKKQTRDLNYEETG